MSEYKFQYSPSIPVLWVEENMKGLIFSDVTKKGERIQKNFKGVLAKNQEKPVGMVLGLPDSDNKNFRILSLKVLPEHQNRKIATRMLLSLEQSLKKEGFQKIDLHYRSHWPTIPVLKRLFQRLSWGEPQFHLRINQSLIEQAFPVFHSKHELPDGYGFKIWSEVTEQEKEKIKTHNQERHWYPEDVSPFQLEHLIEKDVSIALTFHDEIIGWLIIHQITQETLEYTALFVDENHRSFKIGHLLMGEGINRQAAQAKFPKFLFTVKAENKVMVRFIDRNGPVNGMVVTDVYESSKLL
jgi:GNAT superfamily N-acetyltransferase